MKSISGTGPVVAIVGCGAIADSFYLPALTEQLRNAGRLILVDSSKDRLNKLAARYQVTDCSTDYHDVIGTANAAVIAVPHHLHYSISRDFLTSGAHVLCEKPLAENSTEAREMVQMAVSNNVTLSVNNTRRLFPSNMKAKELVASGVIGEIRSIRYFDGGEFNWPTASGFYFDSKISSKGVALDIGAHVIDLICWWLDGKPEVVSSENDSFGGCEAVASIHLKLHDCNVEVRLSRLSKLENRFRIEGTAGVIEGDVYDWKSLWMTQKGGNQRQLHLSTKEKDLGALGQILVSNFLDVVRNGNAPIIPADGVVSSIEILDETYAKAKRFLMPWYDIGEIPNAR